MGLLSLYEVLRCRKCGSVGARVDLNGSPDQNDAGRANATGQLIAQGWTLDSTYPLLWSCPKCVERLFVVYAVYENPMDFPGKFVVRPIILGRGWLKPAEQHWVENTLPDARKHIPNGLTRLERIEQDDPAIVETWL